MKHLFLAIASGLLYALSFPTYSFTPLAWVWAVPLLFLMDELEGGELFFHAMVTGVVAWAGILYWIAYVMNFYGGMSLFPATVLLLLLLVFLSLFFGAFALLGRVFIRSKAAFVLVPGVWAMLELVRSYVPFSGFPWALLGYSQYPWLSFVQIAEFGGVYVIGGVVVMANVALYQFLKKREFLPVAVSFALVASLAVWGDSRMDDFGGKGSIKAAVAQADIDQDQKWDPGMVEPTISTYERLTQAAVKDGATLVVWPETSCPFLLFRDWPYSARIVGLSRSSNVRLLVGSPAYEESRFMNRMWMLEGGKINGFYDKVHLVPFGEYLPLASLIQPFFSGLTREVGNFAHLGKEARPIEDAGIMICFESIFPGLARDLCRNGARYLVNASNDAWFKTWSTPRQHLEMAAFRTIETRRWLLSSTNHGISAIVSPSGRIVREIGLLKEGYATADITPLSTLTFYTRFGPIIAFLWAGASVIAGLTMYRRKC